MQLLTNQSRHPLFYAALALSLGLWTGLRAWRPPIWWIVAIVAFILAAFWFMRRRSWLAKSLALATWFLVGALLIQIRGRPSVDPRLLPLADGRPITLTAHVIREGYAHAAGPRSVRQSIDVETEQIESDGADFPIRAGIRLSLYNRIDDPDSGSGQEPPTPSAQPTLTFPFGTRLRIPAKLHLARDFRNPGAFDYEGYLRDNGINAFGSAQASVVELLPGFSGSRIVLRRTSVHASIIRKIHELWPASQATLMDAMVLGEESSSATPPARSSSAPAPTIFSSSQE